MGRWSKAGAFHVHGWSARLFSELPAAQHYGLDDPAQRRSRPLRGVRAKASATRPWGRNRAGPRGRQRPPANRKCPTHGPVFLRPHVVHDIAAALPWVERRDAEVVDHASQALGAVPLPHEDRELPLEDVSDLLIIGNGLDGNAKADRCAGGVRAEASATPATSTGAAAAPAHRGGPLLGTITGSALLGVLSGRRGQSWPKWPNLVRNRPNLAVINIGLVSTRIGPRSANFDQIFDEFGQHSANLGPTLAEIEPNLAEFCRSFPKLVELGQTWPNCGPIWSTFGQN